MTALSSSGRHSSLPLLLRLALLARMNGSLIQPAYPLSLLRDTTLDYPIGLNRMSYYIPIYIGGSYL